MSVEYFRIIISYFLPFFHRLKNMKRLQILYLMSNSLMELPDWFDQLQSLTALHLDNNSNLTRLHPHVASLYTFSCLDCDSITEPPSAVCQGGFEDIRQYYDDLKKGSSEIVLSTIVLIGRKEAGKSTLLRAMQNGFSAEAKPKKVKKTAVFEFQEVNLKYGDDMQEVQIIDFGGDDVYHYAYQLTFRDNCIPIVVVNIREYKEISEKWGCREAARRVAFDWLSHLLIVSPRVEQPLLVLTHADEFKGGMHEFNSLKQSLISTVENLRDDFLDGENMPEISILQKKDNQPSEIFNSSCHVFDVGYGLKKAYRGLPQLQEVLYNRVIALKQSVPDSWIKDMKTITCSTDKGCLNYSELPRSRGESVLNVILGYMKRSGIILSYPDAGRNSGTDDDLFPNRARYSGVGFTSDPERANLLESTFRLSKTIFHNIPAITKLINALYSHSMTSTIMIECTAAQGEKTGADKARKTVAAQGENAKAAQGREADSYLCNGILDSGTMDDIIPSGTGCIPSKIALELLQKFRLVYGPSTINGVKSYLIPYFMPQDEFVDHSAEIQLHSTVTFCGLRVPSYAFHQLTVVFLQVLASKAYQIFPYGNGASAKLRDKAKQKTEGDTEYGEVDVHLIHEIDDQRVLVKVKGSVPCVTLMWETFKELINALEIEAQEAWPATKTDFSMPCPHCLILGRPSPSYVKAQAVYSGKISTAHIPSRKSYSHNGNVLL